MPIRVSDLRPSPATAPAANAAANAAALDDDSCVVCGVAALVPLKCKVICRHCGTIVQSCADLHA